MFRPAQKPRPSSIRLREPHQSQDADLVGALLLVAPLFPPLSGRQPLLPPRAPSCRPPPRFLVVLQLLHPCLNAKPGGLCSGRPGAPPTPSPAEPAAAPPASHQDEQQHCHRTSPLFVLRRAAIHDHDELRPVGVVFPTGDAISCQRHRRPLSSSLHGDDTASYLVYDRNLLLRLVSTHPKLLLFHQSVLSCSCLNRPSCWLVSLYLMPAIVSPYRAGRRCCLVPRSRSLTATSSFPGHAVASAHGRIHALLLLVVTTTRLLPLRPPHEQSHPTTSTIDLMFTSGRNSFDSHRTSSSVESIPGRASFVGDRTLASVRTKLNPRPPL